jgi:hypothetical protein
MDTSIFLVVPERHLAIAFAGDAFPDWIAVLTSVYEDLLHIPMSEVAKVEKEDPSEFAKYVGTYRGPGSNHDFEVALSGQELKAVWGLRKCTLVPTWPHRFTCVMDPPIHDTPDVRFELDGQGKAEYLVTVPFVGKRVSDEADAAADTGTADAAAE